MHFGMSRTFHLLMLLHIVSFSFALPSSVEIDLIFPRNDTIYKPVWPFPIVFAVRNASQLWESDDQFFDFWVKWDLMGYTDINDSETGQLFTSGVWQTDKRNGTTNSTVMVIDASRRDLVNATQRQFQLRYTTTMFASCPVNVTGEGADSKPQDVSYDGKVVFTTDPNAGQVPAIADTNSCPAFVGSFEITDARHDWGSFCPVVSPESPASEACGLKMDEALANEVKVAMLDRANCPQGTWPDPEGKLSVKSCNAISSSAGAKALGAIDTKFSALVLILAASWALV
ncbi:hypothetical protein ColTof4_07874 [Colletotrichum tofieldiae]|uniref:DUF7136 domain-containing protein n=1 Tax=Colletotrichum tofieldiae TaxID=708197 RepID=A0A166WXQ4_9PEZI|nr:hypothetical protein CT0861_08375 [Colletotrichum tofieldiae]GKT55259.1 hypothetical protein ColTof3_02598 [Colletotrichum tofieldiae]GKT75451.1 hypothetical protein ColTof4_07874 [Colletotrichum tofieldiae]GKT83119.1 hypothetical protein Ct61P_00969 [Colletotrichum tofieldiae]